MKQKTTKIALNPMFRVGEIDRRMFSTFLEPIYDWVHGCLWNPNHPSADELGFRKDVLDLVRELEIPGVRLPGGNFISGYEWEDSIGPREQRKAHIDLAWRQIDRNEVGHDEYLAWAEKAGTEPFYTLNLGTGTLEDAIHCVEYTRVPGGTWWSDLRRKNGYEEPYPVKLWCLGNEMDAPWEVATYEKDPKTYGIKACEASRIVKTIAPDSQTVVCGTSTPYNRTYPEWDVQVLKQCYDAVDYLSLHHYHVAPAGDLAAYFAGAAELEDFLKTEIGVCDYVKALLHSNRDMEICFDEYAAEFGAQRAVTVGRAGVIDRSTYQEFNSMLKRPLYEHDMNKSFEMTGVTMLRALSDACMLMVFMRHADRVKIACSAQGLMTFLVSDSAVIRQIGWYAYRMMIRYAKGVALLPAVEGPTFDSEAYNLSDFRQSIARRDIPYAESAAALDSETGELNIFVANRCWDGELPVEIDVSAFPGCRLIEHIELYADDLETINTGETPFAVVPQSNAQTVLDGGAVKAVLKKLSLNVIRLKVQ